MTIADHMDLIAELTLPEFFTEWDIARREEVEAYKRLLECATHERQLQAFLYLHRHFLTEHLRGGHGRWVIPGKRLGAEYVTDFVIGESHSMGFDWVAVELESPKATLFTKAGDPSATLSHAIRQIQDWRSWLQKNLNYAQNPESDKGLGLTKIRPDLEGLILIGRRSMLSAEDNVRRQQMSKDLRIEIHTFDYLVESTRAKVAYAGQPHDPSIRKATDKK